MHSIGGRRMLVNDFMMYTYDRSRLKAGAPLRLQFIGGLMRSWDPTSPYAMIEPVPGAPSPTATSIVDVIEQTTKALVIKVHGEEVLTTEESEASDRREAEQIIADATSTYGVNVRSDQLLRDINGDARRRRLGPDVLAEMVTNKREPWSMSELRGLRYTLQVYGDVLGAGRARGPRHGTPQELTVIGRLNKSGLGTGHASASSMSWLQAIGVFTGDRTNADVFILCHEFAHALADYCRPQFVIAGGYWTSSSLDAKARPEPTGGSSTELSTGTVWERPPTKYGETNLQEDFADSLAMFFLKPRELQEKCPHRFDFLTTLVASWRPEIEPDEPDTTTTISNLPPGATKVPRVPRASRRDHPKLVKTSTSTRRDDTGRIEKGRELGEKAAEALRKENKRKAKEALLKNIGSTSEKKPDEKRKKRRRDGRDGRDRREKD